MSAHSPLPWVVGGPFPSVSVCYVAEPDSMDGPGHWEPVCMVDQSTTGEQNPIALADARLIVRAVNAHDELVAAVREAELFLRMLGLDSPPCAGVAANMRAALSKAGQP